MQRMGRFFGESSVRRIAEQATSIASSGDLALHALNKPRKAVGDVRTMSIFQFVCSMRA
jgi:hypothetical protein